MAKEYLGVLGGMGPMATADLFIKIIENTAAKTCLPNAICV